MRFPISRFRREIFALVDRAAEGEEISLSYKGRLFRIRAEIAPEPRLERIRPLQIVNPAASLDQINWQQELIQALERDWADL